MDVQMTLDEIKRITTAATPGPWLREIHGTQEGSFDLATGPWHDQRQEDNNKSTQDAAFIAMARTVLPKLIAVAEAAQKIWSPEYERGGHDALAIEAGLYDALQDLNLGSIDKPR